MDEPVRILVVDDELRFCRQVSMQLSNRRFLVEIAASGPEALDKAHACNGDFEVALIDQSLGPPNGIEIMQELRSHYPHIQVIILTGFSDIAPGERAMELGAFRYMSKPIKPLDRYYPRTGLVPGRGSGSAPPAVHPPCLPGRSKGSGL